MIARVKIAPVEQWCGDSRNYAAHEPAVYKIVGVTVGILTESMMLMNCKDRPKSKYWRLCEESDRQLDELTGDHHYGTWICEHMLEMD